MFKSKFLAAALPLFFASTVMAAPQGFNQAPGGPGPQGGPQGFNNAAPNTVAGVLAQGYDDQIVHLRGRLTNYLGKDRYEFTDLADDRIEVELDDDRNWSHISKGQLIEIAGEVDKDIMSTTIEVKQAMPVKQ